ncbi:hypothetical protein Goari_027257 [Gossypium aridum]|uniref:BOS complex subunit TMEM147 n=1 Tax=Gossypium aridum TaxID=34290 RepID=A0A7J8YMZ7_GOSAI|nr:hypothetical protein [Gossypium aridum]
MTMFHFFNCAILTFGPHAVYYSATPLSEYDTLGTSVKAALVYLGTALIKSMNFNLSTICVVFVFSGTFEGSDWFYRCCWTLFCLNTVDS